MNEVLGGCKIQNRQVSFTCLFHCQFSKVTFLAAEDSSKKLGTYRTWCVDPVLDLRTRYVQYHTIPLSDRCVVKYRATCAYFFLKEKIRESYRSLCFWNHKTTKQTGPNNDDLLKSLGLDPFQLTGSKKKSE